MQLAHPLVAAGVADHSAFGRTPWDRLWGTIDVVLNVVFGDGRQAREAAERVTRIHEGVVGERAGVPYSALDPNLLLWVHATLVSSALETWERFVGALGAHDRERYYQEMKAFAEAFGLVSAKIPPDLGAFDAYLSDVVPMLEVTAEARRLSRQVLWPSAPPSLAPFVSAQRLITTGLLPPSIRSGFGLAWSSRREALFRSLATAIRGGLPLVPRAVRLWPHARIATLRAAEPPEGR